MLALLATVALLQQEPPRLRTLMPNGAAILIERTPGSPTISVQLWASARRVRETPETHGFRHLIEHLTLRRGEGQLDMKLEEQGGILLASTLRDAMQIEISAALPQLDLSLEILREVMAPLEVTQEQIDREVAIIEHELALEEPHATLSAAAWRQAYGDDGLTAIGSPSVLRRATPEILRELHARQFSPSELTLVISGDVDLNAATRQARSLLQGLEAVPGPAASRQEGNRGRVEVAELGEARAAPTAGFSDPLTAYRLAAALAIASEHPHSFVTYTPSSDNGLIVVGRVDGNRGLSAMVDAARHQEWQELYLRGRSLARAWVNRKLGDPRSSASLRGLLMCLDRDYRPEIMLESLDAMTLERFLQGCRAFRGEEAVWVVGRT